MIERINSNEVERFNRSRIEAALGRSVRPLGIQRFGRSEENLNRRCKNPIPRAGQKAFEAKLLQGGYIGQNS